ncbi:MAG: hypothetical protein ACUZ8N_05620 [Candidatus Scalindua sp.]
MHIISLAARAQKNTETPQWKRGTSHQVEFTVALARGEKKFSRKAAPRTKDAEDKKER